VLAWLVGVGFLVKREYFRPGTQTLAESAARLGPGASYYTLAMGGAPIGYASSIIDTAPGGGFTIQNIMVLDIQALGTVQKTTIIMMMNLTRTLRLRSFDAQLNSETSKFAARGHVEGDTLLDMTIEAGATQHQRVHLAHPIVLPDLVNLRLAVGGDLKPGRTYTLQMFDPLLQQQRDVGLRVLAESTLTYADSARYDSAAARWVPARRDTVHAFRIAQTYAGISAESWIDGRGDILSSTTPMGFTMQRTAFEIAVENWKHDRARGATAVAGAGSDIINATAIASNVQLQTNDLAVLRARLVNVSLEGFDLAGGRQRLAGDTLIVTRETGLGSGPRGAPPVMFNATLPLATTLDTSISNATQPEPLIQSDDPRIVQRARAIIGTERRAGPVAAMLTRWVYHTLEKKISPGIPSAVQVLESKSGDCNEHTALYVALARAVGLPARTAVGVMYHPRYGRFYFHAWPEVWLGQWVAVDPTWGQFPADASHLRFVIGGLARQVELVRLLGRLRIDVVSSE
jgi:hypothetical protein